MTIIKDKLKQNTKLYWAFITAIVLGTILITSLIVNGVVNRNKNTSEVVTELANNVTPTPKVEKLTLKKWPLPKSPSPENFDFSKSLEEYISSSKNLIPVYQSVDEMKNFSMPKIYDYSTSPKASGKVITIKNSFGMTIPYMNGLTPRSGTTVGDPSLDCKDCMTTHTTLYNKVQYEKYESINNMFEDQYRLTFYKNVCYAEETLDNLMVRENYLTRTKLNTESIYTYYYLGRINLKTENFKNSYMIYWILDDDGQIDEYTTYVVDYYLEDQWGNNFKNTLRGTKANLDKNYEAISELIASFKSSEKYFNIYTEQCDESMSHYDNRISNDIKKISNWCDKSNPCTKYDGKDIVKFLESLQIYVNQNYATKAKSQIFAL